VTSNDPLVQPVRLDQMTTPSHPQIYETIGLQYRKRRKPDPRIAQQIFLALGDASTVCNIGAGTGSYEPTDREVTAVEPSSVMISQRSSDCPVVCSPAEDLPFEDNEFDAAMAILSVHHWQDPAKGLAEMQRVSRRQVVFTFDPALQGDLWLVSDYLPEILEFERDRALPIATIASCLGANRVESVPIPWDCTDGFQAAYWRRPEEYLNPEVQATISTLAQLPEDVIADAMRRLSCDLESGNWSKRYAALLDFEEMDFGYRLLIAESNEV